MKWLIYPFPPVVASSGHEWWYYISTVRIHIGRWTGRSTPTHCWLKVVKNNNFLFVWLALIFADEVTTLPSWYEHPVVKNGDFTILHLELILADELTDLPPVVASSWSWMVMLHFYVRAHIVRCSGRSSPHYCLLVVKNDNFTFVWIELILANEVADLPPIKSF